MPTATRACTLAAAAIATLAATANASPQEGVGCLVESGPCAVPRCFPPHPSCTKLSARLVWTHDQRCCEEMCVYTDCDYTSGGAVQQPEVYDDEVYGSPEDAGNTPEATPPPIVSAAPAQTPAIPPEESGDAALCSATNPCCDVHATCMPPRGPAVANRCVGPTDRIGKTAAQGCGEEGGEPAATTTASKATVCSDRASCGSMFGEWCGSDGLRCNCDQGECVTRPTTPPAQTTFSAGDDAGDAALCSATNPCCDVHATCMPPRGPAVANRCVGPTDRIGKTAAQGCGEEGGEPAATTATAAVPPPPVVTTAPGAAGGCADDPAVCGKGMFCLACSDDTGTATSECVLRVQKGGACSTGFSRTQCTGFKCSHGNKCQRYSTPSAVPFAIADHPDVCCPDVALLDCPGDGKQAVDMTGCPTSACDTAAATAPPPNPTNAATASTAPTPFRATARTPPSPATKSTSDLECDQFRYRGPLRAKKPNPSVVAKIGKIINKVMSQDGCRDLCTASECGSWWYRDDTHGCQLYQDHNSDGFQNANSASVYYYYDASCGTLPPPPPPPSADPINHAAGLAIGDACSIADAFCPVASCSVPQGYAGSCVEIEGEKTVKDMSMAGMGNLCCPKLCMFDCSGGAGVAGSAGASTGVEGGGGAGSSSGKQASMAAGTTAIVVIVVLILIGVVGFGAYLTFVKDRKVRQQMPLGFAPGGGNKMVTGLDSDSMYGRDGEYRRAISEAPQPPRYVMNEGGVHGKGGGGLHLQFAGPAQHANEPQRTRDVQRRASGSLRRSTSQPEQYSVV